MLTLLFAACTMGNESAPPADSAHAKGSATSADTGADTADTGDMGATGDTADTGGGADDTETGHATEPCASDGLLLVEPAAWDYGAVAVGAAPFKTFEVCNATDHAVNLTGEASTAPSVFVAGYPTSIVVPIGLKIAFRVTFMPADVMSYTDTVTLTTELDGDLAVALAGTGAAASP